VPGPCSIDHLLGQIDADRYGPACSGSRRDRPSTRRQVQHPSTRGDTRAVEQRLDHAGGDAAGQAVVGRCLGTPARRLERLERVSLACPSRCLHDAILSHEAPGWPAPARPLRRPLRDEGGHALSAYERQHRPLRSVSTIDRRHCGRSGSARIRSQSSWGEREWRWRLPLVVSSRRHAPLWSPYESRRTSCAGTCRAAHGRNKTPTCRSSTSPVAGRSRKFDVMRPLAPSNRPCPGVMRQITEPCMIPSSTPLASSVYGAPRHPRDHSSPAFEGAGSVRDRRR
jgi:hypothetical protein